MSSANDDEDHRRAWFERYVTAVASGTVLSPPGSAPYRCPCCRKQTLSERGHFEICDVCFWEDDGQDDDDADSVWGGPNGSLSLTEARENYLRIGACEERVIPNVRPPRPDEE